jgi:hypothetical protein
MMEHAHRISFVGPGTLFGPGDEKHSAATVEKASKELETVSRLSRPDPLTVGRRCAVRRAMRL